MKKIVVAVIATALAVLAGCATPKIITLQSEFDADEARALLAKGNNTIKGSALMRQRDGGVVTCAGNEVGLIPNTAYAAERMYHRYGSTTKGVAYYQQPDIFHPNWGIVQFAGTAPEYRALSKGVVCDAQGFFKFTNVTDGSFFVGTKIQWSIPISAYSSQVQGGILMQRVDVRNGETAEIVLAP